MCFQFTASPGTKVLLNQMKLRRKLFTRGKEILEQLSKPRFFTGFKSRALFSLLRSREIKGDIFALRKKLFL